ncbi:MAG: hypothetical protein MPI95_06305 [Nitrosopumilus sp.]|nr:hypothetical protein [Nitrosopumilus sp.]CAI9831074.1 conserved exported hypothetical protein [Nitrosopumilaceae archaeon]MDA7941167.1 hypothetical protein [Nitrosopumilus sp.]MDA7942435.1 hypothetical protein [Nitrosopumilus sp.]MDA7944845.1 hypothetical protein [Nitrosopumilus sp.]
MRARGIVLAALAVALAAPLAGQADAQAPSFARDFGDVKFLEAYFGTLDSKIEVDAGDSNVPFTVVFANVGTQDITGISGQLSLPFGFSGTGGPGEPIQAASGSNSLAGQTFHLTFFVNVGEGTEIRQYPGSVKVDYSRLRESGVRTSFGEFAFKVTGNSVINTKAVDPFLTSLRANEVTIEITNDGTAPISGVEVLAANTQADLGSMASQTTNVQNVVILDTNWDAGHIEPGTSRQLDATIYVPASFEGATLRIPLDITYYNPHGDRQEISKVVDFFVKGLVDLRVFNVDVIELSGTTVLVGEVINEGNVNGLFGFVTVEGRAGSNIRTVTQFIDEIEIDAPVPFNVPLEFDGDPSYGEHEVKVTVRYKDGIRDEIFLEHDATVTVPSPPDVQEENPYMLLLLAAPAAVAAVVVAKRRRS